MGSYVPFSDKEAAVGVEYAQAKYAISLDITLLRTLADRVRAHMEKNFMTFPDARHEVLNGARIYAKTQSEAERRSAIKGALGKMFGRRKKFTKLQVRQKRNVERKSRRATNGKGQYELLV